MSPMVIAAQCDQCGKYVSVNGERKTTTHPPVGWVERWEQLVKKDTGPPDYRRTFCSSECLCTWEQQ